MLNLLIDATSVYWASITYLYFFASITYFKKIFFHLKILKNSLFESIRRFKNGKSYLLASRLTTYAPEVKKKKPDYVTHHITKYSVLTWYVWIKNKLVDRHVGGFCDRYWRLNEDQISSLSTLQTSQINIDKQCPWQYRTVLYNELTVICHFRHWSLKRKEQVSEYSDHKEQMKGSIISLSFL